MIRRFPKAVNAVLNQRCFIHSTPALMDSPVDICDKDGVRELKLNQPKKRNVLSLETMECIIQGLCKTNDDVSIRCVVVSSTGPVFSSGHNFKEIAKGPEAQRAVFDKCVELMHTIREVPVPVIAKVDGLATAAGCQFVASVDILACSERSTFSCPGANYGLFCHTPGVAIARVMPRMKSSYMLFMGTEITAQEAYISGLASVVVPHEKLDEEVKKICDTIKSKSRPVIKMGKEFYYKQLELNFKDAYTQAAKMMVENLSLDDTKEGVKSFLEKRKPQWKHS